MTWLVEERARRDALSSEVAELRKEMRAGFAMMTQQFQSLDLKVSERIHALDNRVLAVKADLMKWSLILWVSAVGAIAVLAGVLR